jgi:hypothetical protein
MKDFLQYSFYKHDNKLKGSTIENDKHTASAQQDLDYQLEEIFQNLNAEFSVMNLRGDVVYKRN